MKFVKKMASVPVESLVFDPVLYPRQDVDGMHIRALTEALEAGAILPPIVAETDSLRVTDGWHRGRAYRRAQSPVPEVHCYQYEDDTEALRHAVELNAGHGLRLTETDRRRIAHMLREREVAVDEIAVILHVPPPKVLRLVAEVAVSPGGAVVPLKRSVRQLAGQTLTERQVAAVGSAPGTTYTLLARQLVDALENRLVPEEDEALDEWLRRLSLLLVRRFGRLAG